MKKNKKVTRNIGLNQNDYDNKEKFPAWDQRSLIIEEEKWLNSQEAADYLKISIQSLYNRSSMGQIPYYKFGRGNRYALSELRKLLLGEPRGGLYGN